MTNSIKKIAIIWSQETANNYFASTAYSDLFMTAQHQAEAAGVSYDILTADQLATMSAASLAQYSALVIPSMTNVQDQTQATTLTTLMSQLESQGVGIITSGNFMTADANNVLLPTPYLAMQTLLGATYSTSGTGTYSVSVDPGAASNPIMAGYTPGALIGGASGQFAGTTAGYYTNTGYASYAGFGATPTAVLADINVTTAPGAATTSSVAGVIQTTTGATNTLFATTGLLGDSNLLQHVIQNAVFGSGPSLTLDTTRFKGIVNSRTDMDQSQFPAAIKPTAGGAGIYDAMIPILQQWTQQYDFVGSFYTNVGNGPAGSTNAGNALTLTAPYLKQLMQMGSEIGSHSTDHLIAPPTIDANGVATPATWSENTNTLYLTPPANNSAPNWTYAYEYGQSNTLINQALGITVAGAAVPGAADTSATALNTLQYYPSANGLTGYVNGGWTGVGSGSPNAFGYIDPSNTNSVYIAPNITFDFTEVQYQGKTAAQTLADWETLFTQLSANSQQPIIVWPWHDYGVTNWNTSTNTPNAGNYSTQMFTDFVAYAYNQGYEFVTSEELAARIAAEQRATITETNPTANTINVTVTPGVATDDLGAMALNVANGGANVIQNAGAWYAYDGNSVFVAKGGVSNVTVTLGATQDDVTHIDALPMRADLQTVTGDGSNLSFSFTGDGAVDTIHIHVKTPDANIISVLGAPVSATLIGDDLSLTFNDGALATSPNSPQGAPVLHTVTVYDQATAVAGAMVVTASAPVTTVHANDISLSGDVTGPYNFIDLLNLEASYGDLIQAFGTNAQAMQNWFNNSEPSEKRPDTFDGLDYIASYADLINGYKSAGSEKAVLDAGASHFITNGFNEGRTTTFNGLDYIASYGDLIKAIGVNGDAGAYHFIENGASEGRTTSFDGLDYIASYSDLIKAYGANEQAGASHFIQNGFSEGRSAQAFDVAAYETAHPDLIGKYASNDAFLTSYITTYATTGKFLT